MNFLRSNLRGGYYKPYLFKSLVLGVKGRLGHISGLGENVTQSERFFLGGRDIRGFNSNGIGPRDTGSGGAVGGNNIYTGTVEIVSNLGVNKDAGVDGHFLTLVLFGLLIFHLALQNLMIKLCVVALVWVSCGIR